jgi:hypothetical protein
MKKLYIGSLLLLFAFTNQATFSQSITASGINPVIGDVFTYKSTAFFNAGSSGSGQTWSFPGLTGTTETLTAVSVASTPFASSFPTATLAEKQGNGSAYLFYANTSSAQVTRGYAAGIIQIVYSNPEEMLHFPFSFGNSYTDYFLATFNSGGSNYTRRGSTTVTADAIGTLTTPAGTFTNVLRVRIFQNYQDSTNISGSSIIINYTNTEYFWYKDGYHYPLATSYTFVSSGSPSTGGSYFIPSTIGIDENSEFESNLRIFPNPVESELTVSLNMETPKTLHVSLMNLLGEKVMELDSDPIAGSEKVVKLQLDNLRSGIYIANVSSGNLTTTRKIVVE